MTDRAMTTRELAESLGVPVRTVQDWRYRGGGPAYHYISPRQVRYWPADVARWLKQQRRAS